MRSATVARSVATARARKGSEAPISVVGTTSPAKHSAKTASGCCTSSARPMAMKS
jgi:hypothetical protein